MVTFPNEKAKERVVEAINGSRHLPAFKVVRGDWIINPPASAIEQLRKCGCGVYQYGAVEYVERPADQVPRRGMSESEWEGFRLALDGVTDDIVAGDEDDGGEAEGPAAGCGMASSRAGRWRCSRPPRRLGRRRSSARSCRPPAPPSGR